MFTLSGLILGTRQNLFRDFWSPFSISFYFSSEWNYLKKNAEPTLGRTRPGLPGRGLYKSPPRGERGQPPSPRAQPAETLTLAQPRRRRPPPLPEPRVARGSPPSKSVPFKKNSVHRFSFSSDFLRLFSDRDF